MNISNKSTINLTTAQALIKFLDQQYISVDGTEIKFIKGVFAIFGHGNVLGIGQALEEDAGDLILHQGRNEQGMALAAMGFAKQNLRRQIYACSASVGPGSTNMVTAAAAASANRIPLLLLPADVYACRQPDPVLQQCEQTYDASISANDAFRAVSRYWDRISRPQQLMSSLLHAMRVLTSPADTGAVTLALPQDVQAEVYAYPVSFFKKRVHRIERTLPTQDMLLDALRVMLAKSKPLIICGGGAKYSGAGAALEAFAERFNIPITETQAGKSTLLSEHPLNLGGIGVTGSLAANMLAKEADLIIGIGTRYTDFTTGSKGLFKDDAKFLNINIAAFDAGKMEGIQVVADAKITLEYLLDKLIAIDYEKKINSQINAQWRDEIIKAKAAQANELKRIWNVDYTDASFVPEINDALDQQAVFAEFIKLTQSCLTQSTVLGVLNEHLGENDIIVGASGSLPGDLQRAWCSKAYNSYHLEYGYSCMGYEVNAGLGVKLAEPNKDVFVLVGDGAYMMAHSELVTSIQERAKINIILFDNMTNGCINNLQIGNGMSSFGTEFRFRDPQTMQLDGGFIPIDFAMNAASYGCKTYRVTTLDELHNALADARTQKVSTLIDIKVLPKTMLDGYLSWWRVGLANISKKESITAAARKLRLEIEQARAY
ncbi:acetolactate synthase isozyme I large subunit [Gammaproteobacteria bacterium]|nr:acetolactate synthase isozyme I large subunit [Gammaproteobacteria bacterium]